MSRNDAMLDVMLDCGMLICFVSALGSHEMERHKLPIIIFIIITGSAETEKCVRKLRGINRMLPSTYITVTYSWQCRNRLACQDSKGAVNRMPAAEV